MIDPAQCSDCSQCARCGAGGPMGVWRKMNGRDVFTGIVKLPPSQMPAGGTGFKKLDDPEDGLDGAGHDMEVSELFSQFSLYDDSTIERAQKPLDVFRFPNKERDWTPGDVGFFDTYVAQMERDGNPPIDFSPHDVKLVRAGDFIVLKARGEGANAESRRVPAVELFWALVVSVTPCGQVTASPANELVTVHAPEGEPFLVPLDAVMAVVHGPNWAEGQ